MNWNDFASYDVQITCANMAKMNRVRAWARKNGATVLASRYARDAYEGRVKVPMKQGREQQAALVAELKEILSA